MKLIKNIKRFIYDKYCILRYGETFVSLEDARSFYKNKKDELIKPTADLISDILWPENETRRVGS